MKELSEEAVFLYADQSFSAFFQHWFFGWKFSSQVSGAALETVMSCVVFTYPAG